MALEPAGQVEFEEDQVDRGGRQTGETHDCINLDRGGAQRFDDPGAVALVGIAQRLTVCRILVCLRWRWTIRAHGASASTISSAAVIKVAPSRIN
jgi:hypothetical protein